MNLNSFTDTKSRYDFAEKIIDNLNERLNNGWTIFNEITEAVYEDQLQYASSAKVYKKAIDSNNNFGIGA